MALTGQEFNDKKGTQGNLIQWIWALIFPFITNAIDAAVAAVDLSQYYTKSETDAAIAASKTAIETLLANSYDTSAVAATKVQAAIDNLVDNAPTALNTLKEIADNLAALGVDEATIAQQVAAILTTVEGKASQADLSALTTTVDGINSTVQDFITNTLPGLVTQAELTTAVDGLNANIYDLTSQIYAIRDSVTGVQSQVDSLITALDTKTDKERTTTLATIVSQAMDSIYNAFTGTRIYKVLKMASIFNYDSTNDRYECMIPQTPTSLCEIVSLISINGIVLRGVNTTGGASYTFGDNADFCWNYNDTLSALYIWINPDIDFDFSGASVAYNSNEALGALENFKAQIDAYTV